MMENNKKYNSPIISFIITDYNISIELLKQCIESILSLEIAPDDREIILIDDGSYISPFKELSSYQNQVFCFSQPNKGLSAARNKGIELAKGKYIQFVDGDDSLITNGYKAILKKIIEYDSPSSGMNKADIIFFNLSRNRNPPKNIALRLNLFWWTTKNKYLTQKNIKASACGYIFRRQILGELRFTEGIFHEDEEFTPLLIIKAKQIFFTSINAYYYRLRETSITNNEDQKHINARLTDFFNILIKLNSLSFKSEYELLKRRVHQLTMDYIYNVITQKKDPIAFKDEINKLSKFNLFPLPIQFYTIKYFCFSLISRSELGRRIIYKTIIK